MSNNQYNIELIFKNQYNYQTTINSIINTALHTSLNMQYPMLNITCNTILYTALNQSQISNSIHSAMINTCGH